MENSQTLAKYILLTVWISCTNSRSLHSTELSTICIAPINLNEILTQIVIDEIQNQVCEFNETLCQDPGEDGYSTPTYQHDLPESGSTAPEIGSRETITIEVSFLEMETDAPTQASSETDSQKTTSVSPGSDVTINASVNTDTLAKFSGTDTITNRPSETVTQTTTSFKTEVPINVTDTSDTMMNKSPETDAQRMQSHETDKLPSAFSETYFTTGASENDQTTSQSSESMKHNEGTTALTNQGSETDPTVSNFEGFSEKTSGTGQYDDITTTFLSLTNEEQSHPSTTSEGTTNTKTGHDASGRHHHEPSSLTRHGHETDRRTRHHHGVGETARHHHHQAGETQGNHQESDETQGTHLEDGETHRQDHDAGETTSNHDETGETSKNHQEAGETQMHRHEHETSNQTSESAEVTNNRATSSSIASITGVTGTLSTFSDARSDSSQTPNEQTTIDHHTDSYEATQENYTIDSMKGQPVHLKHETLRFNDFTEDSKETVYTTNQFDTTTANQPLHSQETVTSPHSPYFNESFINDLQSFHLGNRSLCPWKYTLNKDENRHPEILVEAECLLEESEFEHSSTLACASVKVSVPVLRNIGVCVDDSNKIGFVRDMEELVVACALVVRKTSY